MTNHHMGNYRPIKAGVWRKLRYNNRNCRYKNTYVQRITRELRKSGTLGIYLHELEHRQYVCSWHAYKVVNRNVVCSPFRWHENENKQGAI